MKANNAAIRMDSAKIYIKVTISRRKKQKEMRKQQKIGLSRDEPAACHRIPSLALEEQPCNLRGAFLEIWKFDKGLLVLQSCIYVRFLQYTY